MDSKSARPYYVVVDAGGWFKSKHFLLPVGHARFDADARRARRRPDRDRIDRFPGFDKDKFDKLTDEDLKRFNDETCQACSITGVASCTRPTSRSTRRGTGPTTATPTGGAPIRRCPIAWAIGAAAGAAYDQRRPAAPFERDRPSHAARRGRAKEVDPSPHFDGRAQPGDVLGVETGGEQTHIGDTAEDENKRRQDAEETDAKRRRDSAPPDQLR